VVLISPLPLSELGGETVWLSTHSATSVALLQVLLEEAGLRCKFRSFDHHEALPEGPTLLIGDEALRQAPEQEEGRYVYDLAEMWKQSTGLPMVFAVLALRRELLEDPGRLELVEQALSWMEVNLSRFRQAPTESKAFGARRAGLDLLGYLRYFAGFCFDWNRHTEAGFDTFRLRAEALGLASSGRVPELYDPKRHRLRPLCNELSATHHRISGIS
jgi:chorismate dehydratase